MTEQVTEHVADSRSLRCRPCREQGRSQKPTATRRSPFRLHTGQPSTTVAQRPLSLHRHHRAHGTHPFLQRHDVSSQDPGSRKQGRWTTAAEQHGKRALQPSQLRSRHGAVICACGIETAVSPPTLPSAWDRIVLSVARRRASRSRTPLVDSAAAKLQVVINGTSCQPGWAADHPSTKCSSVTA